MNHRELDAVLSRCQEIAARHRAARHPFVATLDATRPDRARLGDWAAEKYHQVFLQNAMFSAIHANAWDREPLRQFMVEQILAEETSIIAGSDSHYGLMRRFAAACGVGRERLQDGRPSTPVLRWVRAAVGLCRDSHPAVALVALHAIEGNAGEAVARVLTWLRDNHTFTERELEWFSVHAEAEDDHAASGLALVKQYAHEVPDFAGAAPRAVETLCAAWTALHDHYLGLVSVRCAEAA